MGCTGNTSPRQVEQSNAGRMIGSRIVTAKWPEASAHSDSAIFVLSKSACTLPLFFCLGQPDLSFVLCKFLHYFGHVHYWMVSVICSMCRCELVVL